MRTELSPRIKIALYGLLCVLAIPFLFPTWRMVTSSVKPISQIFAFPPELIPRTVDWSSYADVFRLQPFAHQYWNSCYIAAIVTIGTMAVSSLAGYAFARIRIPGSTLLLVPMLGGMPSVFSTFVMRQFFIALPVELEEAARGDGLGRCKIFWTIALPLARPALAAVAIFTFLQSWNLYLVPIVYLSSPEN